MSRSEADNNQPREATDVAPLRARLRRDADGYQEWVRLTDGPLLILAVAFLAILVLPYAVHLSPTERLAVRVANVAIWAVFAIDYFVRLNLARDRRQYVRRNILDLLIVIVPFLRPLRAARLLRLLRLGSVAGVVSRRAGSFHARVSAYVASTAAIVVLVASYAIWDAEHTAPNANIRTVPDALWWSVTTITTVGYGDRYPTTASGKGIAVALMVVGIALLGVITASIAAWFVDHLRRMENEERRNEATLDQVLTEVQRLHERLDALEHHETA